MAITSFRGKYFFLSNFCGAPCTNASGMPFRTVEHAFQAAKATTPQEVEAIRAAATPAEAKRLGRTVQLVKGWDSKKVDVMRQLLYSKFSATTLRALLLETGEEELVEGNTWGDQFWGVCYGVGENHLGKLLMQVRRYYRDVHGKLLLKT